MPPSTPTQIERRRAPRYLFGGVAEVVALGSGKYLIAVTRELSRLGCFVKTATPFPAGEEVILTITHDNRAFAVSGEVAYALPAEGMGIAFGAIPVNDEAVLENWRAEITV